MSNIGLSLIFNARKTGIHALKVIAGALGTDPRTRLVQAYFTSHPKALTKAVEQVLAKEQKALAWSFYSQDFGAITQALGEVRQRVRDPRVIHLAGGVHATAEPEQTLSAGFDFVALGEGERTIIDVVTCLQQDKDPRSTRGIAYWDEHGQQVNHGRGAPLDLNEFPPFAPLQHRFGPIEITRGCIYACRFCQTPFLNKARFRHRTVENVCHYVGMMRDQGLRDYRFITPSALSYGSLDEHVRLDRVEALLASVRAIIGPRRRLFFGTFPSELRPEHVTAGSLAVLRRYVDNDNLVIGGQSGSPAMLEASHRGHDVEVIIQAVRLTLEAGFRPNVDFIFGLPGERPADVRATLQLAQYLTELGARVHGHTFMPLPGTPFKNQPPGRIDPETHRQLDGLSSQGRLYGQWERQQRVAEELASLYGKGQ